MRGRQGVDLEFTHLVGQIECEHLNREDHVDGSAFVGHQPTAHPAEKGNPFEFVEHPTGLGPIEGRDPHGSVAPYFGILATGLDGDDRAEHLVAAHGRR